MYRLMLYYLIVLVAVAVIFCFIGILPYSGWDLIKTSLILVLASVITNKIISATLKIPTNAESDYITGFILTLIITPGAGLKFLIMAAILAQASKYILAYRGKHIFNPAAIAVVITFFTIQEGASWWIGSVYMLPLVIIGGFLIMRKIQRFDLVLSFLGAALLTLAIVNSGNDLGLILRRILIDSSLLFFASVMIPEPMTSPPTRNLRIIYGALIGFLYSSGFTIGSVALSPEMALVLGNIFSFIVSPKGRYKMTLKSATPIANQTHHYVFNIMRHLDHKPGQYMDWTVDSKKSDIRGNRRYFTIASSPTESEIMVGVKFYDHPSTFKQKLQRLKPGDRILGGGVAGDFILPSDVNQKLVFMAGGIGITPFRSMIKYLLDKNEKRDIVLFYSNKNETEIAYKNIFDEATVKLGIKVIYVLTDNTGYLNAEMIKQSILDLKKPIYMISGPRSMVVAFEDLLKSLGVSSSQIQVDFFPGYV